MNIANLLAARLNTQSNAPAIIEKKHFRNRTISFGQFNDKTAKIAASLQNRGITPGKNVLILHPMSIELYLFMVALLRVGAVPLFIDPTFGRRHVQQALDLCKPVASFMSPMAALMQIKHPGLRAIPREFTTNSIAILEKNQGNKAFDNTEAKYRKKQEHETKSSSKQQQILKNIWIQQLSFSNATTNDNDPALITFTSGSNGEPKAISRTHGFLRRQLASLEKTLSLQEGQVDLTTLPIFLLANLAFGVTTVIPCGGSRPSHLQMQKVLKQITDHKVTRMSAAPKYLDGLCAMDSSALESLSSIYAGGGPIYSDLQRKLRLSAPNASINMIYGSTECEPIASINLANLFENDIQKTLSGGGLLAGYPQHETRVKIANDKIESKEGEIGRILVTGEHVVKSYLSGIGDAETKHNIDGEIWHDTGDSGYFDQQGRLWLTGRYSRAIKDNQGVIYPLQVEAAVRNISGVAAAACLQIYGKRTIIIQPQDLWARIFGANREWLDSIKSQLSWANIEDVLSVGKIPVDARHGSKIDYTKLLGAIKSNIGVRHFELNESTVSRSFSGSYTGAEQRSLEQPKAAALSN